MRGPLAAAALAACLSLPGTAFALFDDDVARARVEEVRKQVGLMEERISKLEDRRALVDLDSQIEALKIEIARMRGQLEVIQNQIETADKRSKDLYLDIDTRLRKIEQPKETAGANPANPPDTLPQPAETKAYEAALNQFKLGNYPLAISAFQGLLVTYPASKLAPNAQYWIGNAQAAQGQYKLAIFSHQKLLATWPDDAKAPDSMMSIATAQEALGDRRGAQKTLEALLAKYPQSPAAASAKQRLAQGAAKK
ncbi:MAG TPA: tol-pal system protein YbgF [Burkholderiales bacterium]|nr:tol-pal system protein YbgF [Burkholderiales bacterium]